MEGLHYKMECNWYVCLCVCVDTYTYAGVCIMIVYNNRITLLVCDCECTSTCRTGVCTTLNLAFYIQGHRECVRASRMVSSSYLCGM